MGLLLELDVEVPSFVLELELEMLESSTPTAGMNGTSIDQWSSSCDVPPRNAAMARLRPAVHCKENQRATPHR